MVASSVMSAFLRMCPLRGVLLRTVSVTREWDERQASGRRTRTIFKDKVWCWEPQFVLNISTELNQVVAESGEWSGLLGISSSGGLDKSRGVDYCVLGGFSWSWRRTHPR